MTLQTREPLLWISTMEIDRPLIACVTEQVSPFRVVQTDEGDGGSVWLEDVEIWATYGNDTTPEMLNQMPNLRWIQLLQSGYDRVPVDDLCRRGVRITTTHGVHAAAVAEYVLLMTLYFLRDMEHFRRLQAIRHWDRTIVGSELAGKIMVIVGTGAIGVEIGTRAAAFGMRTIGVNRTGRRVTDLEPVASVQKLDAVLTEADVVVSVLPGGPETRHFWNKERLERLKADGVFINVGRGSSVDTEALLSVVHRERLKGVALDVFEEEPLPQLHPLWSAPRVVLTPHMAAKTMEYLSKAVYCFLENFKRYRQGLKLMHEIVVK